MTLDKRILDIMKKYMGMLVSKKVLTTMEEVEANTNETNLVAAPVVAELNDKLAGQPEFVYDANGKITGYKTPGGADTVFPFHSSIRCVQKSAKLSQTSYVNINCGFSPNYIIIAIKWSNETQFMLLNIEKNTAIVIGSTSTISPGNTTINSLVHIRVNNTGFDIQAIFNTYTQNVAYFYIIG